MKPARFDYLRATTLAEAHAALVEDGNDARIVAGGQTLMPMLSMRLARPKVLVDIMHLPELRKITSSNNTIRVGAAVRQAELLSWPELAKEQPLLAAALPWVGHPQTRSRGTVCGSAAHADPSAEIPLSLIALGGTVELSSRRKRRSVAAEDFFTGMMSTARDHDEMIEAVTFPTAKRGYGYAFSEFGRRHGDFAIVACAAVASDKETRLAIGGVADRPSTREFGTLEGSALDDALNDFAFDLDARDDLHATARYRRELVRRMGRATIEGARQCRV
ncbi:FAD binding domain-containing protein [Pseudorhodoplanes sinuspersici]|uniref:Carbon monoxide dehydrogenase n=1 Tax=Pseudorhodoplanes sinuspersici TaxID=1235591 RepID=A0A1W6ZXP7_9HYPH|nr:FAD binding domain-containing protein [Pseudorhodoplanes sinuspersici]ARQ02058.1 carbon monoxide dehydrogenase [Pseudorhodoplanes sinuspersici]RKE73852.1 2-furoyl-CoA dehydrogenase FAD binding subunit [Pseudorhodoplanes sinuspersici]